ncbi:MAG: hypothetical protein EOM21_20235 [Gammaproteobacteria bacterium]|nr:hypothetical protein [Gammaproteobacteria bacterium]
MYEDRFKDAPWYEGCKNEEILVGGAGGIGSNALYYLAKTIPAVYYLFDPDVVNSHNIGTQFFNPEDQGKSKVYALRNRLSFANIKVFSSYIKNSSLPIEIAGFDNMEARKEMFGNWLKLENREIFIDGRLSANVYQVFVVIKGREEWYEKTLFDDNVVDDGPCTFKQTAYVGGLIGARITHVLVNYLSNKYMKEDVFNLPYFIEEATEPFQIKTHYDNNF